MESSGSKKAGQSLEGNSTSGLSFGLTKMEGESLDAKPSIIWDFLTQSFLFILGGVILCGMLYALVTYT